MVRTRRQLLDVAKNLHNCAASYHSYLVHNPRCVLVALQDSNGKQVALGHFEGREWRQIRGFCNRAPTESALREFEKFLPSLRCWAKNNDGEARDARTHDVLKWYDHEAYGDDESDDDESDDDESDDDESCR